MSSTGTWYPPTFGAGGFLADAAPLLSNPPFAPMTLLSRCVQSYELGCQLQWDEDDEAPMRRVLRDLSTYISQNHYRSTGREIAVLLAAAGAEPATTPESR